MTPEQLRNAAAVMLAAADGKPTQYRSKSFDDGEWEDANAAWDWYSSEYRIKPELQKVKVRLYQNKQSGTYEPFVDGRLSAASMWVSVSDAIEIEVKK